MDFEIEDDDDNFRNSWTKPAKKGMFGGFDGGEMESDAYDYDFGATEKTMYADFSKSSNNNNTTKSKPSSSTVVEKSQNIDVKSKYMEPTKSESSMSALEKAQSMLNKYKKPEKAVVKPKSYSSHVFDEDDISLGSDDESEEDKKSKIPKGKNSSAKSATSKEKRINLESSDDSIDVDDLSTSGHYSDKKNVTKYNASAKPPSGPVTILQGRKVGGVLEENSIDEISYSQDNFDGLDDSGMRVESRGLSQPSQFLTRTVSNITNSNSDDSNERNASRAKSATSYGQGDKPRVGDDDDEVEYDHYDDDNISEESIDKEETNNRPMMKVFSFSDLQAATGWEEDRDQDVEDESGIKEEVPGDVSEEYVEESANYSTNSFEVSESAHLPRLQSMNTNIAQVKAVENESFPKTESKVSTTVESTKVATRDDSAANTQSSRPNLSSNIQSQFINSQAKALSQPSQSSSGIPLSLASAKAAPAAAEGGVKGTATAEVRLHVHAPQQSFGAPVMSTSIPANISLQQHGGSGIVSHSQSVPTVHSVHSNSHMTSPHQNVADQQSQNIANSSASTHNVFVPQQQNMNIPPNQASYQQQHSHSQPWHTGHMNHPQYSHDPSQNTMPNYYQNLATMHLPPQILPNSNQTPQMWAGQYPYGAPPLPNPNMYPPMPPPPYPYYPSPYMYPGMPMPPGYPSMHVSPAYYPYSPFPAQDMKGMSSSAIDPAVAMAIRASNSNFSSSQSDQAIMKEILQELKEVKEESSFTLKKLADVISEVHRVENLRLSGNESTTSSTKDMSSKQTHTFEGEKLPHNHNTKESSHFSSKISSSRHDNRYSSNALKSSKNDEVDLEEYSDDEFYEESGVVTGNQSGNNNINLSSRAVDPLKKDSAGIRRSGDEGSLSDVFPKTGVQDSREFNWSGNKENNERRLENILNEIQNRQSSLHSASFDPYQRHGSGMVSFSKSIDKSGQTFDSILATSQDLFRKQLSTLRMRLDEMNKVNGSASTRKINGFNDSLLSGYASTNRKDTTTRGSRVHANSYSSVKDVLDQHKVESRKKLRLALLQVDPTLSENDIDAMINKYT